MRTAHRLRRFVFAAVVAFASALGAAGAHAAADPPYASWFRYNDEVLANWTVSPVEGDPMQAVIRHRNPFQSTKTMRVLVLYPRPSSAYDTAISKILEVFQEKGLRVEFRVFNFNRDDARGIEALKLADDYDLIFSMGSESTAWLYDKYRNGKVPVVTICSKDPVELGQVADYEHGSGTNFAFTSLNMPIEVQMAYLLELKPGLKNLAVLVDSENVSAVQTQAEPIARYARARGIQVLNVAIKGSHNAREELKRAVATTVEKMRRNDLALTSSVMWITGSTAVFGEIATINDNADRVPVLSVVPEVVKAGDDSAVLSIGVSFESNAHLAAIYGSEVLLGRAKAGDLKVGIVSPPDIAINFRKARAIGLKVPFSFFESAGFIYDYEGRAARAAGKAARERPRAVGVEAATPTQGG
jgi:putative tryptophan/tyrosine transport system substrate-binding protein